MSVSLRDILDLKTLVETVEVEFKLAGGVDGKGHLPKDFWPTYSAMANTRGGWIILGVQEKQGKFIPIGIQEPEKIRVDLFNTLNNPSQVSLNLLNDSHVQNIDMQGKQVIAVNVPAAKRSQKPIYIKGDPLRGTYRRLNEADVHCDSETVKRMLAEQIEESRDDRILTGFGIDDIDLNSLISYKQLLFLIKPQHPWLELDNFMFLKHIGGWRKDRASDEEGLTLAGLLMFGKWSAIQDALVSIPSKRPIHF